MSTRTKALAALALPAAAIGYFVTAAVLDGWGAPDFLLLIAPLFVAALCMVPFVLPLLDQMAKRDLAAHRAEQAAAPPRDDEPAPPG
jgi:fatty acid desaturase